MGRHVGGRFRPKADFRWPPRLLGAPTRRKAKVRLTPERKSTGLVGVTLNKFGMNGSHGKHQRLHAILTTRVPADVSTWPRKRPLTLKLPAQGLSGRVEAGNQLGVVRD